MNAGLDRRSLILAQPVLSVTGIDFVRVVDPTDQRDLEVYFFIDPDKVIDPTGPGGHMIAAPPVAAPASIVSIVSQSGGESVATCEVVSAEWRVVAPSGVNRTVLAIRVREPGDFSNYVLTVHHPLVDRFFNGIVFSFKQACPNDFDCRPQHECPDELPVDADIDYLARDFVSFRNALIDFAAARYPNWRERIPADAMSMLMETLCALEDERHYIMDRYARERFIDTAVEPRSLLRHARLVDFRPAPPSNAGAWLAVEVAINAGIDQGTLLDTRDRIPVYALPDGQDPIAFEIGDGLFDTRTFWLHSAWNAMALHMPDVGKPCLPEGATEAYLRPVGGVAVPTLAQLPAGQPIEIQAAPERFWIGRWMMLRSTPADRSIPSRRWLIRVVDAERTADPLGGPLPITRVRWDAAQALPFELNQSETVLLGNLVPALSGRTVRERFRIGPAAAAPPAAAGLRRAIEREGILDADRKRRALALLHGLAATEADDLAWLGVDRPEVRLIQHHGMDAAGNFTPPQTAWTFAPSLLDASGRDPAYTLDPGLWRTVVRYENFGNIFEHSDYATARGWTLRFGDGEFGQTPPDGALFEAEYRVWSGVRANVAPDTITALARPAGIAHPALAAVAAVTNPLPASGAREGDTPIRIRQLAPEMFRARPERAVRDEDYRARAEDLDWVQQANAIGRWTGSWISEFVTADPFDSFELSPARREELAARMDAVRQAGREVHVLTPRYVPVDLDISICAADGSYPGQVKKRVLDALTHGGRPGETSFFDPDSFTFGVPLRRSAIEAAVQAVPGVKGVIAICIRVRRVGGWRPFNEGTLPVGLNEIIRVQNDPRFPERGSINVRVLGEASEFAGCGP